MSVADSPMRNIAMQGQRTMALIVMSKCAQSPALRKVFCVVAYAPACMASRGMPRRAPPSIQSRRPPREQAGGPNFSSKGGPTFRSECGPTFDSSADPLSGQVLTYLLARFDCTYRSWPHSLFPNMHVSLVFSCVWLSKMSRPHFLVQHLT